MKALVMAAALPAAPGVVRPRRGRWATAQTARCLPPAIREADERRGYFDGHGVRFRLGRVTIRASEGGHRTAGGRRASYAMSVEPR